MDELKIRIKNGVTIISTGVASSGKKNMHGHPGITYVKRTNKYRAELTYKKRRYHLGYFFTVEDAVAFRKIAEEHVEQGSFTDWYRNEIEVKKNGKRD